MSFIYGGRQEISKPNLLLMTELLHIPVCHVSELEEPEHWSRGKVLLTVFVGSLVLYAFMWLTAAY